MKTLSVNEYVELLVQAIRETYDRFSDEHTTGNLDEDTRCLSFASASVLVASCLSPHIDENDPDYETLMQEATAAVTECFFDVVAFASAAGGCCIEAEVIDDSTLDQQVNKFVFHSLSANLELNPRPERLEIAVKAAIEAIVGRITYDLNVNPKSGAQLAMQASSKYGPQIIQDIRRAAKKMADRN